jgi:hypothetical protein
MKPRIRYLAGLAAPAAGPTLRPPRQLFGAGTYLPPRSPATDYRQRANSRAGRKISDAPVLPDPDPGAPVSLPDISQPGDEPAADRAFTSPGHSHTLGPLPTASWSLAPKVAPPSDSPAIPGTPPASSAPPMASGPGAAAARAAGAGTGPMEDAWAVHPGRKVSGQARAAPHPPGAARIEPPPGGTVPPPVGTAPPPASADHGLAASPAMRLPPGHSRPPADAAPAPWPESRSASRQGQPAGLPSANEPVPSANEPVPAAYDRPTASADRDLVPARPGEPGAFPDLLPPPVPAPQPTELPQPDADGLRHRSRSPQSHRVSIGTIEVTVVPPVPAAPAHRISPPPRPVPVPPRPASQLGGGGGSHRFRRWYGTAQS